MPHDYPDSMPLADARDLLRKDVYEGVKCPLCTQHAQVYRWSLYGTAARVLIKLYRAGGVIDFVHSNTVKVAGNGGDCTRLAFWGLVEQEKARRADGGRSGFWRVTEGGESFVLNRKPIPKYAYVYNGRVLRIEGPPVTVYDALGKKFDYSELMQGG